MEHGWNLKYHRVLNKDISQEDIITMETIQKLLEQYTYVLFPLAIALINFITSKLKKLLPIGKKLISLLFVLVLSVGAGIALNVLGCGFTGILGHVWYAVDSWINAAILFLVCSGVYSIYENFKHKDKLRYSIILLLRKLNLPNGFTAEQVADLVLGEARKYCDAASEDQNNLDKKTAELDASIRTILGGIITDKDVIDGIVYIAKSIK